MPRADSQQQRPMTRRWPMLLGAALVLLIYLVDLAIPLGYAGGMGYMVPTVLGLWVSWRYFSPVVAAVASALTVSGFFSSPSGGVLWIVLVNRAGAIVGVWVIALMVLQYKRMEATARREQEARERLIRELEQVNAELERFTYTVSHDLKSPLITIKGFCGMLERGLAAGDQQRLTSDVTRIAVATDQMQRLLDELLDLSRVGHVVNPPEDVALTELAGEVVELLAGPIRQRNATLEVAPDLPVVRGDRQRLREVLQNLVENALKFSSEQTHPRVEIGCRRGDQELLCYVRDNGIGIEPQYADRVFRLFERLDADQDGSGVGLALVKRIVEGHGGSVWVESKGIGKGATFCFTLPLAQ